MVYCIEMDDKVRKELKEKTDFILCKGDSMSSKFSRIIEMLAKKRGRSEFPENPESFKNICKFMILAVSKTQLPVKGSLMRKIQVLREEAGSFANISLWGFWNPKQQAIMSCDDLDAVILTGSFSVGKTTTFKGRALKLANNGEKVLFINAMGHTKSKTLMTFELEEHLGENENITFMAMTQDEIHNLFPLTEAEPRDEHLIIDEYHLAKFDKFPNFSCKKAVCG
jgi:hypothetical protein